MFPAGTLFGEVLRIADPAGGNLPFECRVKERRLDGWSARVFRLFPTRQQLIEAILLLRPQWRDDARLSPAVRELVAERGLVRRTFTDYHHHAPAIHLSAAEYVLPEFPDDLVRALLTRFQFEEATGVEWESDCHAPTSRQAFSIVPANYDGNYLGTTDETCRQCHRVAGFDGDLVDRRVPKQKYGDIPGNDEILSFHPFDPRCISRNGFPLGWRVRLIPGIIEPFDARVHTADRYRRLASAVASIEARSDSR
jgi:hypothetical protein